MTMTPTATEPLTAEQIESYHRDGYHIARGLIGPAEAAILRDAFMDEAKNGPVEGLSETQHAGNLEYDKSDPLKFYPRILQPHRHPGKTVGKLAMRYLLDRRIRDILRVFFAEEPIAAQTMFYFKPPGARGQDFHQDNFYLKVAPGTCMAAWIALDDADPDNGGMMVVPGTHRMDLVCPERTQETDRYFTLDHVGVPEGLEAAPANLKAGDVLFFNGSVIHGSHPNTSKDRFRRSLICHYVPESCIEVSDWYRPLHRFDGSMIEKEVATGGGPCGTFVEAASPH